MYGEPERVIFCDKNNYQELLIDLELAVGDCVIMDLFPIIFLHFPSIQK